MDVVVKASDRLATPRGVQPVTVSFTQLLAGRHVDVEDVRRVVVGCRVGVER
jgi:hypothetical protein